MSAISLRELTEADMPAVIDMWVAAWAAAMPVIDFEARRDYFAARLVQYGSEGASRLVAIAADGRPCGLLVVNPATQYLDQITVATSQMGTGLAKRLLAEAQRLSPGGLTLHVNQDNPRAIRFYEKKWLAARASQYQSALGPADLALSLAVKPPGTGQAPDAIRSAMSCTPPAAPNCRAASRA